MPDGPVATRTADRTRQHLLDAAIDLLDAGGVADLTVRAVAPRAGMSERTVFRYFATRDEFLEAVAAEVGRRLELPTAPTTRAELATFADPLFRRFEARASLTRAALHTELFTRMRNAHARVRWTAIRQVIDATAPAAGERERRIAAANIRYVLSATTWHYYRTNFELPLDETIACANTVVAEALRGVDAAARRNNPTRTRGGG